MRVAAALDCRHAAGDAVANQIERDICEADGGDLVNHVWFAGAQIVSQIAVDNFVAGALANFLAENLADVGFLAMAEGVGFAIFLHFALFPNRAFRSDHERVAAGIIFLVFHDQVADAAHVKRIFGNQAADSGDVSGVERGEARVAAEDAKNSDALVRADGGALARDGVARARDGGGKAEAVFGALNVIVHGLRHGDHGEAGFRESGSEAERVVTANRDQAIDAQALQIADHDGGEVVNFAVERKLFQILGRNIFRKLGGGHFARIGARGVQDGAAGAVDGARVFARELANIKIVVGAIGIEMREPFPSAANAGDGAADLAGAVVTDLMTGFRPGTSPPPVRMPIFFVAAIE